MRRELLIYFLVFSGFFLPGCGASKKTTETSEKTTIENNKKQDSLTASYVESNTTTVYAGAEERFIVKPDTISGELPEFEKKFDNGAVASVYGYSKAKGIYYSYKVKSLKETEKKKQTDTVKNSTATAEKTTTAVASKTIKEKEGLSWITKFWLGFFLILVLYILYRLRKALLKSGWVRKLLHLP